MRALTIGIVGGTGFVGRALGERLTERGRGIRVLTRRLTNAANLLIYPMIDDRNATTSSELVTKVWTREANQLGILSPRIFTMMVLMALVTTFMTGPILSLLGYGRRVPNPLAHLTK